MSHELGIEEIAILIKPLGNGRVETCIYKDPDNILDEEELELALQVAVTMNAFFELALDEDLDLMATLQDRLEEKIQEILDDDDDDEEEDAGPLYTSKGNVLKINRFTKTKGRC
jgi:copper homeostasis protein CutC|tara:strand:+ start:38 stop:379 length:342 start_codon:yes stop_codon:yes gene_type:complete